MRSPKKFATASTRQIARAACEKMTDQIAQQFVVSYYQTFDTNRAGLGALYVRVQLVKV